MIQNLRSAVIPTWCPGCDDYLMYAGINQALTKLEIPKEDIVMVFDIGCVGNMADFFSTYGIHSLHGRCVPTAIGVKLANPKLTVLAIGGDGGVYGEGLNHLLAAARANYEVNVLVANNQLYSLTTGQASPTSPHHSKTKSTPLGTISLPITPISLVKSVNPDAFAESLDGHNLSEIVDGTVRAIKNPGFSLLDLRQICVTFGKQLSSL